jgi:phosphoribosyl-ATP pyrophosphohydrolase/phosphoribosyl-AMP cyclohydrolase
MPSVSETLWPVVVQNRLTRQVMMLAYANEEALTLTKKTGLAHFYSRSRQRLWKKGETSGHVVPVHAIIPDCDQDAFLYLADAPQSMCHRGSASCFGDGRAWSGDPLVWLDAIVRARLGAIPDQASYTQRLGSAPLARVAQKVGEEAVEVVIASLAEDAAHTTGEIADLLYHLSVLMARLNIPVSAVSDTLAARHVSS